MTHKWTVIDPLVMECAGDKIVISSPRLDDRLRVPPAVASRLLDARDGITADPDDTVVATLAESGFLLKAEDAAIDAPVPWNDWGTTAWTFHKATRDVQFIVSAPADLDSYREKIQDRSRPSGIRPPHSDSILLLPRVRTRMQPGFQDVLEGRRTHRHFHDEPLALDAFSDLLHYTFAPLRFADAGEMGVLQLRASASGGARHETEAFVAVFNVAEIEPGLYHYDNIRHGLEPLNADVGREQFEELSHGQGFFTTSAFGVLSVAVADRMSWKYRHAMAYKMLLHNVGHMAQVFSMTATALGLGAAITGAIRNSRADELLGLDQPREFTTFAMACGTPVRRAGGMPASVRTPRTAPEYY